MYLRSTIFDYKKVNNMVSIPFIGKTQEIIEKIKDNPKLDILTLVTSNKKIDIHGYSLEYNKNVNLMKKEYQNIVKNNKLVQNCIKYNNLHLYNAYRKREYNYKFYRTLSTLLNRMSLKTGYGALTHFIAPININENKNDEISNYLFISEERNCLENKTIENIKYSLHPSLLEANNKYILINQDKQSEKLLKLSKTNILEYLISFIINHNAVTKIEIINCLMNKYDLCIERSQRYFEKLINIGVIIPTYFDVQAILSTNVENKYQYNSEFSVKTNNIYDVKTNTCINISSSTYNKLQSSIPIYIYLLKDQLDQLKNEKHRIAQILSKHLMENNKEQVPLLDFLYHYGDEILTIRNDRINFTAYFRQNIRNLDKYDVESSEHFQRFSVNEVQFNNLIKNRKYEVYFSTIRIGKEQLFKINGISPPGIYSSRFDYLYKNKKPLRNFGKRRFIEVLYKPYEIKLYHSFRRMCNTEFYLNVNIGMSYENPQVINLSDIYITILEDEIPILFSIKHKIFFEPVTHSTLSSNNNIVMIFFKMISTYQQETYKLPKAFPPDQEDFSGRIIINNLIITNSLWKISVSEMRIIKKGEIRFAEYLYLIDLFKKKGIPRYVSIFSEKKCEPYPIDLYNPFSLVIIKRYFSEEFFFLEELLPSPESADKFDKINNLFTEYYWDNYE